jgi:voltage-gated potassium channel
MPLIIWHVLPESPHDTITFKTNIMKQSTILNSRAFNLVLLALIFISVISFSIETLPNTSEETRRWLFLFEATIVGIFTIEYIFRIVTAERPLKFIFSFYGLIDLLAILPFYLATSLDLRSLRLLRLLRILTLFKLVRYNKAITRFVSAINESKSELFVFSFASAIVLYLSAVGIYHFEHAAQPEVFKSLFDSLWWAVATLTTVGYGDIYPITVGGKIFTFFVLLIGLGLVAVPTGIIASALSRQK